MGDLIIDGPRRRVMRDGKELLLGRLTFDLLAVLASEAPDYVSIDDLMRRVWPKLIVGPETVSQRVKRLREALGDSTKAPRYIEASRGRGYRLMVPVTVLAEFETTPPAVQARSTDVPSSGQPGLASVALAPPTGSAVTVPLVHPSRRRPQALAGVIGVALISMAIVAGIGWMVAWRSHAPSTVQPLSPPARSVAVIPFANLTGDASSDYLGDGMAEELIDTLARLPGLTVTARISSFAYKGRNIDVRRIGRDLGVSSILEGSVRSAGERIRVTAQLVSAQTGYELWSQSYDRSFTDVLQLQDEIAAAIAQALPGRFGAGSPIAPRHESTKSAEAYRLYLRARALSHTGSDSSSVQAFGLLDQAIALDPRFARALADRALARMKSAATGHVIPHALEDSERDAGEALGIDPDLAEAPWALGINDAVRGNWVAADASFQKAMTLNPVEPELRADYAIFVLESTGHLKRAIAVSEEAHRLAPRSPLIAALLAAAYSLGGEDRAALALVEPFTPTAPPAAMPLPLIYGAAALRSGRFDEAAERSVLTLHGAIRNAGGAQVMKQLYSSIVKPTQRSAAVDAFHRLLHEVPPDEIDPLAAREFLTLLVQIGYLDDAFDFANRSLDGFAHHGTVGDTWGTLWTPELRPFRKDPRFHAFVHRLKFADYWRRYGPPDGCRLEGENLTCP